LAVVFAGVRRGFVRLAVDALQRYRQVKALAVTYYLQSHFVSRALPADSGLQLAGIVHFFAVEFSDDVANFQACLCTGRVRFNLADQCSAGVVQMEETRVFRSHIVDAYADSRMLDFAILEQRINYGPCNLRWNGEAHPGKTARRGNQKRVDANHFTMRIHQRSAGIARIDGCIGLDKFARFTGIVTVRVRTVQRAHNAASHGETEVKRVTEGQNGLSGLKRR